MTGFSNRQITSRSAAVTGLGLAGLLAPPVALYAPKGISVLFIIAALGCLVFLAGETGRRRFRGGLFPLSVSALVLWGAASLTWSVSFDTSWSVVRSLPFAMLGGLILIAAVRALPAQSLLRINRVTLAGFVLGAILALADILSGYDISQAINIYKQGGEWSSYMPGFVINNGITVLAVLLWPALLYLGQKGRHGLSALAVLAMGVIAVQGSNFAAVVALAAGAAGFTVAYYFPRRIHQLTAMGLTALLLGAPFALQALPDARTIGKDLPEMSVSVYPRLVIWQYASNRVMENPVLGHGIRTSRELNRETEPIDFLFRYQGKVETGNTKAIPLHPHNGVVQMWLELGGIGAVIGLAVLLSILSSIERITASPSTKALLYAAFLSSVCLISVSYGLWQSWWLSLLWLQGGLVLSAIGPLSHQEGPAASSASRAESP